MAIYVSLAHTCCACRSVERARELGPVDQHAKHQQRQPNAKDFPRVLGLASCATLHLVRRCLQAIYSPSLLLVFFLLRSRDVYPLHSGDFSCFPCRCSQDARARAASIHVLLPVSCSWNTTGPGAAAERDIFGPCSNLSGRGVGRPNSL